MSIQLAARCVAVLLCCLSAGMAQAQATRTWVSGVGDDVNPCSRTAPCKTFAGAISKTAAGGQISVLDPGGYGAVSITKSITIDGFGDGGSILASGTNGVTINISNPTASDRVVLRGLAIDGGTGPTGLSGVRVLSAASVVLEDVAIQNFSVAGVTVQPPAGSTLAHVLLRSVSIDSATTAIRVDATALDAAATVALEDVVMSHGTSGVHVSGNGVVHGRQVRASDFAGSAYEASGAGAPELSLEACAASASDVGVRASGASALITLSECSIAFNGTGIKVEAGGRVRSFGNNRVHANADNGGPTSEIGQQ